MIHFLPALLSILNSWKCLTDIGTEGAATIGKHITLEKSVWIAAGAIIIGGVTVGEKSVVAAGSVVTKDVPPNPLVGGNPARVIRSIGD
jgi:acetyltransferase-like isoleucine patch superfamily enzyme